MKLLNVGCGSVRPGDPWTNLDDLHSQLQPGTPERSNLDAEPNYINWDINGGLPSQWTDAFDGILCSHVIEHFDCHQAAEILRECRRVLKPGGLIVVSVPDAKYFLSVHHLDRRDSSVELFGEPICPDEPWHKSFFDYALFYNQHKQLLTQESLQCLFLRAGFIHSGRIFATTDDKNTLVGSIAAIMNRRRFSLEMMAIK